MEQQGDKLAAVRGLEQGGVEGGAQQQAPQILAALVLVVVDGQHGLAEEEATPAVRGLGREGGSAEQVGDFLLEMCAGGFYPRYPLTFGANEMSERQSDPKVKEWHAGGAAQSHSLPTIAQRGSPAHHD